MHAVQACKVQRHLLTANTMQEVDYEAELILSTLMEGHSKCM